MHSCGGMTNHAGGRATHNEGLGDAKLFDEGFGDGDVLDPALQCQTLIKTLETKTHSCGGMTSRAGGRSSHSEGLGEEKTLKKTSGTQTF